MDRTRVWMLGTVLALGFGSSATAQTYQLSVRMPSTYHREPCAGPCACVHPGWHGGLSGTFDVRFVTIGDVFDLYAVENVQLTSSENGNPVTLTGSGTLRASPIIQQQVLSLSLTSSTGVEFTIDTQHLPIVHPLPYFSANAVSDVVGCNRLTLGLVATAACPVDLDDGTGSGSPDGAVTIDDLIYYLGAFESGSSRADLDDGVASGLPDGAVTIDDLLFMLGGFEFGC